MGCVSSKGFTRGTDYLPMPQHAMVSDKNWDADDHVPAASSDVLNKESFFNIRSRLKLPKMLSREKSFTFMSHSDADPSFANDGTQPMMYCEGKKQAHTWSSDMVMKPVTQQLQFEAEDERKHFLLSNYLQMQQMDMPICGKSSLPEDESKCIRVWADSKCKNGRTHLKSESLLAECLNARSKGVHDVDMPDNSMAKLSGPLQLDTEVINMQELMEGLEDNTPTASTRKSRDWGMLSIPNREISFNAFPDLMSGNSGDLGSPVWKKYYMLDSGVSARYSPSPTAGSPFNESPRRAPLHSPFTDIDDARSTSSNEPLDVIGLKILLSPSNSSFHPSPINKALSVASVDGNVYGTYATSAMSDGNLEQFSEFFHDNSSPYGRQKQRMESMFGCAEHESAGYDVKASDNNMAIMTRLSSRRPSMESVYSSGSPLFDPSLMATFEQALEASMVLSPYDNLLLNERLTLSSSVSTCDLFSTSLERESTQSDQTTENQPTIRFHGHEVKSKVTLASCEVRCPPRGEGKVVLYFTSLRGIRKTYEDCCDLRLILRGLGIQVDERDVWMHSEFRSELKNVLDGLFKVVPQVPQLFIKGRYIGGADVVKQLHEEDTLSCLMDGIPMGLIQNVCKGCGDARFVPCFACSGSRKVLTAIDKVTKCLTCNENGLTMCPICIM